MTAVNGMLRRLVLSNMPELSLHPAGRVALPPERLERDKCLITLHANFTLDLAANRCWSQGFYGFTFPYLISQAWATDERKKRRAGALWQLVTKTIVTLEEFVLRNPLLVETSQLLTDMGTCQWQLTRECMITVAACGYNPDNQDVKDLAWTAFAGPTTTKDFKP